MCPVQTVTHVSGRSKFNCSGKLSQYKIVINRRGDLDKLRRILKMPPAQLSPNAQLTSVQPKMTTPMRCNSF
jgi:hypothetical protein